MAKENISQRCVTFQRALRTIACLVTTTLALASPAVGEKPGKEVNPNGFPSGHHYNWNIIGKKANFTCPEQATDEFGNLVYGNVVFVPEHGNNIEIWMQSGKGKRAANITELQVMDWCTKTFDGDPAVIQLPQYDQGYRVYARALAKPTDNPYLEIVPGLVAVEDESGNDLIYLGLVTSNGFTTPYGSYTRKKGKSKATNITGLFEWSGDVCYLNSDYCNPLSECSETALCCTDVDVDGVFESCEIKGEACAMGTTEVAAFCKTYVSEWVFNIGDFVTFLWDTDNHGVKLLQVRFYPNE